MSSDSYTSFVSSGGVDPAIDSFAPILGSDSSDSVNPPQPAAAADITASPITDATNAPPSKEDAAIIGAYLFDALTIVFHAYPDLDELGLILGMPASGAGRRGDKQTEEQTPYDPCLNEFHAHTPPPPAFIALQSCNGSPPFIVMEGTKLGISFWSIPFLIKYALKIFQQARQRVKGMMREEITRRAASQDQTEHVHVALINSTRLLLLVNADNYTAWNMRKLLLSCPPLPPSTPSSPPTYLLTPATELRLLNLIYSKHPKSGESWDHRRWVLSSVVGFESEYHFAGTAGTNHGRQMMRHTLESIDLPNLAGEAVASPVSTSLYHTRLFQRELRMCERSAELYPKNYYAWMHRQWLIERLTSCTDLRDELDRASEWTESHINDYCGFFHRQVVWNQWIKLIVQDATRTEGLDATAATKPDRGLTYARAHRDLALHLRSWSKRYGQVGLPNELHAQASDAAESVRESIQPAVSGPSSVGVAHPGVSSTVSAVDSSFHSALASCIFCREFGSIEWSHLNELQLRYPGHETLWMHRRFVWHTYIQALYEHDSNVQTNTNINTSSIPTWLEPLIHRELEYAEFQIRDFELSNHSENARFASIYKAWVLHTALTLVYRTQIEQGKDATITPPASPSNSSFPLIPHLSSPHRRWYHAVITAITQIQPTIKAHKHWEDRQQAASGKAN